MLTALNSIIFLKICTMISNYKLLHYSGVLPNFVENVRKTKCTSILSCVGRNKESWSRSITVTQTFLGRWTCKLIIYTHCYSNRFWALEVLQNLSWSSTLIMHAVAELLHILSFNRRNPDFSTITYWQQQKILSSWAYTKGFLTQINKSLLLLVS